MPTSEDDFIRRLIAPLATSYGAGGLEDDVAMLVRAYPHRTIITTDTLVEGVHFLSSDPMDTVARKLVRVNVSDILAKGARPQEALLNLTWRKGADGAEDFFRGLGEELRSYEIDLIGGDTTTSPQTHVFSLTLTGECIGRGPVGRMGAKAGDDVWVTGTIGDASLGLEKLQKGEAEESDPLVQAYREPALAGPDGAMMVIRSASASMDVSDGLLVDATRLAAASGVGVEIDLALMPVSREAHAYLGTLDVEACLKLASGGDDYQILFTAPETERGSIESDKLKVTRIGKVLPGSGLKLRHGEINVDVPERLGWSHDTP